MRVEILGTSFSIRTDEDPDYLAEVLEHYRGKVVEVERAGTTSDPLKISILAGILASDEYLKLNGTIRSSSSETARAAQQMIDELDLALLDQEPSGP